MPGPNRFHDGHRRQPVEQQVGFFAKGEATADQETILAFPIVRDAVRGISVEQRGVGGGRDRSLPTSSGLRQDTRKQSPASSRIGSSMPSVASRQAPRTTTLNFTPSGAGKRSAQSPPVFRAPKEESWLLTRERTSERIH